MHKYGTLIVIILLVPAVLLGGGCMSAPSGSSAGGSLQSPASDRGTITPLQPSAFSSSNPASVYITYPDFDGGIDAGDVTVMVQVRNFSLVNGTERPIAPGEGHIICFKDVPPRTEPGIPAKTGPGTFQISYQTSCTWYSVSPGTHTFSVELVNNDNTPLAPPVIDAVDVTAVAKDRIIAGALPRTGITMSVPGIS